MNVIALAIVQLLLDVSFKVVLLAAVAGAGLAILRVQNCNARHRVWTLVLSGMTLLPLLVAVTPGVPLPRWIYPAWPAPADPISAGLQEGTKAEPRRAIDSAGDRSDERVVASQSPPAAGMRSSEAGANVVAQALNATRNIESHDGGTGFVPLILVGSYLLGVGFFAGRLVLGVWRVRRLLRLSQAIALPPDVVRLTGATPVRESMGVRVPLTVGWRNPCILLPGDWSKWDRALVEAALAHEQAHVERRDQWVTLLAELNRAVYWFHPLAWFLRHRLATLAEAACDDAVIEQLADRTAYARHLLTVASRLGDAPWRLQPAGVAMARTPRVERRIAAILDTDRSLARRLSAASIFLIVALALPLVWVTAGLRAGEPQPVAPTASERSNDVTKPSPTAEEVKTADHPDDHATPAPELALLVLDDDDHPIPAANVTVRIRQVMLGPWKVSHEHCDQDGRLRVTLPKSTPAYLAIRAELPGHAPFWAEWEQRETADPIPDAYTMHLDPGQRIGGIVQNEQGQPIKGAKVNPRFNLKMRPERTHQMGSGEDLTTDELGRWSYPSFPRDVDQTIVSVKHPDYIPAQVTAIVSKLALGPDATPHEVFVMKQGLTVQGKVTDGDGKPLRGATVTYLKREYGSDPPTTKTDEQGVYRFLIGEEGLGTFYASAADFAPSIQTVQVDKSMPPIDFKLSTGEPLRIHVASPDGAPISGAAVQFWTWQEYMVFGGLPGSQGYSDADGNWRWLHAPVGHLFFAASKPGFQSVQEIEVTTGNDDNVITMSPASAATAKVFSVSGRVVDAQSKEPISKFRVTPGELSTVVGAPRWYHENRSEDRDGQYRKDFPPSNFNPGRYALQIQADGYAPAISRPFDTKDGTAEINFELQKDTDASIHVTTPGGEPATGATVAVCTARLGPTIKDGILAPYSTDERISSGQDGQFSLPPQDQHFALLIVHDSGSAYVTQEQLAQSKTIHLQPWARVEGVVKIHGKPAADQRISIQRSEQSENDAPRIFYDYHATSDKDGKFAFDRVIPGSGDVCRNSVSDTGGGGTSWTPTIVERTTFAPGQTTQVVLSRDGRPVTAKLSIPPELADKNDWRQAMANLQERPRNLPAAPKVPWPKDIDPTKDREAAMKWANEWKDTEEGKKFLEAQKAYMEAMKAFKPTSYSAHVDSDGTLKFDDIPAGDYQLSVQAFSRPADGRMGPGEVIATLTHTFTVPEMPDGRSDEPLDVGELKLEKLQPPPGQGAQPAPPR